MKGERGRHRICAFGRAEQGFRSKYVFENECLCSVSFSRESSPTSSFLILMLGINEIPRKTLAFQI